MFIRDDTPSGFKMMSIYVPSARNGAFWLYVPRLLCFRGVRPFCSDTDFACLSHEYFDLLDDASSAIRRLLRGRRCARRRLFPPAPHRETERMNLSHPWLCHRRSPAEILFRRQFGFTRWRDFSDEDITFVNGGSDPRYRRYRDLSRNLVSPTFRDIARNCLRAGLVVAVCECGLNVNGVKIRVQQRDRNNDGIFEVIPTLWHVGHEQV